MNRTIKIFALVASLAALTTKANAAGEAMFSKGHPVWDSTGVNCTTGTVVQITASTSAYITSGVRLQNQGSFDVWIGYDSNVSTKTLNADSKTKRGEKLAAGASGVWELGYNYKTNVHAKLFCIAADGAGTTTVPLSAAIFAYP